MYLFMCVPCTSVFFFHSLLFGCSSHRMAWVGAFALGSSVVCQKPETSHLKGDNNKDGKDKRHYLSRVSFEVMSYTTPSAEQQATTVHYYTTLPYHFLQPAGEIGKEDEEFRKRRFWCNLIAITARYFSLRGLNIATWNCYPASYRCFQRCSWDDLHEDESPIDRIFCIQLGRLRVKTSCQS